MNSVDAFQKRLHDHLRMVEKEIDSHNQQVEVLTKRLEALRRAAQLFESDQVAVAELLQTSVADSGTSSQDMAARSAVTTHGLAKSPNATRAQRQLPPRTQSGRGQMKTVRAHPVGRSVNPNGGLTRVDMIAAVLRRHPRQNVRELIARLEKEFHWKTTESAVTGNLYTRRDKFVHTQPDRSTNRPVTWSLK